MTDKHTPEAIQSHEEKARKFFLKAGTAYGLLLGLGFALFTPIASKWVVAMNPLGISGYMVE